MTEMTTGGGIKNQNNLTVNFEELKLALDDSSNKNRNVMFVFFLIEFYILISVLGTTDINLFLNDSLFDIRYIQLNLKLFYIIAPGVLVALHFNLLINLLEHAKALHQWRKYWESEGSKHDNLLTAFMFNTRAKYDKNNKTINFYLVHLMAVIMVSLLPLSLLVLTLWKFASYQSFEITLWHFGLVCFNIFLQSIYWFRIQDADLLESEYDVVRNLRQKINIWRDAKRGQRVINVFLIVALSVSVFRIGLLWAVFLCPESFSRQSIWPVPYLNIQGEEINDLLKKENQPPVALSVGPFSGFEEISFINETGGSDEDIYEESPHSIIKKIRDRGLNIDVKQSFKGISELKLLKEAGIDIDKITPVAECQSKDHHKKLDLSGRSLKLTRINGLVSCNTNMVNTDLTGASIEHSSFSGNFNFADMSDSVIRQTKFSEYSSFIRSTFYNVHMLNVIANRVNFTLTTFTNSRFEATQLNFTSFIQSDLKNVEFDRVQVGFADFRGANLYGTTFSAMDLEGVDLRFIKINNDKKLFKNAEVKSCHIDDLTMVENKGIVREYLNGYCRIYQTELVEDANDIAFIKGLISFGPNVVSAQFKKNQFSNPLIDSLISITERGVLSTIDLSYLKLTEIPLQLIFVSSIKTINLNANKLNGNQLSRVPEVFPNIAVINFNNNHIENLTQNWSKFKQVEKL